MVIDVQYTTASNGWNNGPLVPKGLVLHSTAWPGTDAQAHAMGYGDNHADPEHWLRWEGLTMADFREAVDKTMRGTDEIGMSYEQFKEYMQRYMAEPETGEPSGWARAASERAIELGILQGDGSGAYSFKKPLSREAYLALQERQSLPEPRPDESAEAEN